MRRILMEVCVDTIEGAEKAVQNGADRLELCSALSDGGLTPSAGFMRAASFLPVPVYAMIRPRAGSFRYSDAEKAIMLDDARSAYEAGLSGIVVGATTAENRLDTLFLDQIVKATPLGATLHRAFDTLANPLEEIETALALGFERILTSGQARTAEAGTAMIAEAVRRAGRRISIMPGAGVSAANAARIIERTGAREIHASCSSARACELDQGKAVELGFVSETTEKTTDPARVGALRSALDIIREAAQ